MFEKKNSKKDVEFEKIKAYAEESTKAQKPVNKKKEIISNIIYVVIVLAITIFIICFVGQRTKVDGDSMYPTLHDGDNLIVDKISYRFHDPDRFDVIIFPYPQNEKVFYIKRVIGLPGETIQIDYDGNIYIDGEILEEEYGYEVMVNPGIAADPITLGEDEYFVLGDNRNESNDSRAVDVGVIDEDDIIGRAWVRFYPFKDVGLVKNIE
ncbi:MAG: signal peptidase I [Eubacterium sp.]|nr:signal peptidase I [Eubacterium sp.]